MVQVVKCHTKVSFSKKSFTHWGSFSSVAIHLTSNWTFKPQDCRAAARRYNSETLWIMKVSWERCIWNCAKNCSKWPFSPTIFWLAFGSSKVAGEDQDTCGINIQNITERLWFPVHLHRPFVTYYLWIAMYTKLWQARNPKIPPHSLSASCDSFWWTLA